MIDWRMSRATVSNCGLERECGKLFCPPSVPKIVSSEVPQRSLWRVLTPLLLEGGEEQTFQVQFQHPSGQSIQGVCFSEPEAGCSHLTPSLLETLLWCL